MLETQEVTKAIAVEHLVKRYRRAQRNAVDDISFSVRRGETFGLLGPNGAGKTTTIGILTTSVLPTVAGPPSAVSTLSPTPSARSSGLLLCRAVTRWSGPAASARPGPTRPR